MVHSIEELCGSKEELCATQYRRTVWYIVLKNCVVVKKNFVVHIQKNCVVHSIEELCGSKEELCGTQYRRTVWYIVLKNCVVVKKNFVVHNTEELCGT